MSDADLVQIGKDRVFSVAWSISGVTYVVTESREAAEKIGQDVGQEEARFGDVAAFALELSAPIVGDDGNEVPWGRCAHDGNQRTVNELIALLSAPRDTETLLMPFADAPPPPRPA